MFSLMKISKSFGNDFHLNISQISFNQNEISALLGSNGAGKTTLLRILAGLYNYSGQITYSYNNSSFKNQIGYMPEDAGLYNKFSALDNLRFFYSFYSNPVEDKIISQHLKYFGIPLSKEVGTFSRGMKQIVNFIRSIIHEPDIILLDEPFNAVDPENRIKMKQILFELKNKNKCIIVSSHVLDEIEKIADRFIILKKGIVVFNEHKNVYLTKGYTLEDIYINEYQIL